MKDKEINLDEIEASHTIGGAGEGGVQGTGEGNIEGAHATLLSDTLQPNGHTGTDTSPGVWLRNKPTDLSACVTEKRGHGEGGVVYVKC